MTLPRHALPVPEGSILTVASSLKIRNASRALLETMLQKVLLCRVAKDVQRDALTMTRTSGPHVRSAPQARTLLMSPRHCCLQMPRVATRACQARWTSTRTRAPPVMRVQSGGQIQTVARLLALHVLLVHLGAGHMMSGCRSARCVLVVDFEELQKTNVKNVMSAKD